MISETKKIAPAVTDAKSEYRGILSYVGNIHGEKTVQRKTEILEDFNRSPIIHGQRWHDARGWAVKLYRFADLEPDEIEVRLIDHYGHDMSKEMRGLVKGLASKFEKHNYGAIWPKRTSPIRAKAKPKPIDLESVLSDSVSVPESAFFERSEFTLSCGREDARMLISCCFDPGEMVAIKTRHASPSIIKSREEWLQFLVPNRVPGSIEGSWVYANPVRKEVLDRKTSDRHISGSDISEFRFLVLENDNVSLEAQLNFAGYFLPYLQAVVFSGNKSYHCWLRVDAEDENDYRKVLSEAKQLVGAGTSRLGPSGYDNCALSLTAHPRMCGAARGLIEQRLVFLTSNPSADPVFGKDSA